MKIVREENLAAAVPLDLNLLRRKIFPQSSPGLSDM
jgi:hypothetical protein